MHRYLIKVLGVKVRIFSYPSILTFVLGAQKDHLIETVLFEYPQHMFRLRKYFLMAHSYLEAWPCASEKRALGPSICSKFQYLPSRFE